MRSNLSDQQFSSLIGVVARIPVQDARRLFLERIEAALPAKGKVTETQLTDAVNATLASFEPGSYRLDAFDGVWRAKGDFAKPATLLEASQRYMVQLDISHGRRQQVYWPPFRPLTDEERKAKAAEEAERDAKLDALGIKEPGDRYLFESLCNGDLEMFKRRKAEDDAHRAFMSGGAIPFEMWEAAAQAASASAAVYDDNTPFPVDPQPPPRTPVIRGTATEIEESGRTDSFPTDEDLRQAVAEQPDDEDAESPMAKAARLAKRIKRNRGRGRLSDRVKVFFK